MPGVEATIKINDEDALDMLGALIEMEIEEDHRMASVARLKLSMTLTNGSWRFLDDPDRVKLWNTLSVSTVLADTETELFKGYITQIRPHLVVDRSDCCLEIIGMDATSMMGLEEKIKDWPDQTDSDIARAIFQEYGLASDVEDVEITHEEVASTIVQRESDISFLKRLARRNGFECYVRGDTGYFRSPALDEEPQPVLAAHFGADTNLLTFHARMNALSPAEVVMHQIDAVGKEVVSVTSASGEQRQLGAEAAIDSVSPSGRQARLFVRHAIATSQAEMERLTRALYNESEWLIEARGEVHTLRYGAALRTRGLVPIKGVGEAFSGLYYVTNVRHKFSGGGYAQHFAARRNAAAAEESDFEAGGLFGISI